MEPSLHHRTPSVDVFDGRGLSIRQVAYLRNVASAPVQPLITRQFHDVAGRPVEQWDPRLFGTARKANLTTTYGLTGQTLFLDSADAGWRLSLPGLAAEVVRRWDERGNRWSNRYDNQLRLRGISLNEGPETEAMIFGPADADPAHNLRGQLLRKTDASGALEYSSFSLNALPFEETRTLFDGAAYTTQWRYAANGMALSQTDAAGHQQLSRYDVAGQLQQLTLKINGDSAEKAILKHARYNAEGQKIEQTLGNDVLCSWSYDPADGRLNGIKAGVPGQALRQNLQYRYDKVGNVVSLEDLTFNPVYFANQLIDGKRFFSHDSLYRLIRATGHDAAPVAEIPGRPLPSDPGHILNYTQTYEYDSGGNLIKLVHSRAVGGYTRQMSIDPDSNRGVRWNEGDAPPDFTRLFDAHGNLQTLQPGQDLQWNVLDELAAVPLIERKSALPDQENYRYSGGVRVYKHHETQGSTTTHFHQARYLPGLEIRTRETGEALHVITFPALIGNVRCLHWLSGRPGEILNDQLRYCLEDSQSSSLIELDQDAALISQEDHYPFGGTAWLVARSALEASYKTIRYSGKEQDDTGLYYYGRRYYAPWLQRWISADPAGAVDGLNLYAMVGNNPISFVDTNGLVRGKDRQQTYKYGERFIRKVGDRTGEILRTPHANLDFGANARDTQLVAHAGAALHPSDGEHSTVVQATDFFNIPREGGTSRFGKPFKVRLTPENHGAVVSRDYDPNLPKENLVAGGVIKITDPAKFLEYMSERYIQRFNDPVYPVKLYEGESVTPVALSGLEREVPPIHSIIQENIKSHISASGGYLPQSAGLPGAHAEVQAASFMLYQQQTRTGANNPALIEVVTQKLQHKNYAQAFPACYNCRGTLVETYESSQTAFYVPTGETETDAAKWATVTDSKETPNRAGPAPSFGRNRRY
ncbi:RHS repeat-associated core domain-containing protein [Pseudomonas sp. Eth.TT006]